MQPESIFSGRDPEPFTSIESVIGLWARDVMLMKSSDRSPLYDRYLGSIEVRWLRILHAPRAHQLSHYMGPRTHPFHP